jgi:hypothetical protein
MSAYQSDQTRLEVDVMRSRLDRLEERLERDTVHLDRLRVIALSVGLVTFGIALGATITQYN